MTPIQNTCDEHPDAPENSRPGSRVGPVRSRCRAEQSVVLGVEDPNHQSNERHPGTARRVRQWCHTATSEPARKAAFGETQAAEVFVAGENPHLIGRRLHDLRRSSVANVTGVRAAIATVTDHTNSARSREINASLYGATPAAQLDACHFPDIRNERATHEACPRNDARALSQLPVERIRPGSNQVVP
jgi:hypothetical protein